MEKYQITSKGLRSVFKALLEAKATCTSPPGPTTTSVKQQRKAPRQYLLVRLPVYFTDRLAEEGVVIDITEQGLQIVGLETKKGRTEEILIQPDGFVDVYPFQMDALCRWTGRTRRTGQPIAGFEIVGISEGGRQQLRNLVQVLSMGITESESSEETAAN